MIRSVPAGAQFSFRSRIGSAISLSTSFNPISAGISAGVGLATAAIGDWLQSNEMANMGKSGATAVANAMAQQLGNLKNAYFAEQNVTCADQRAALDAFDGALVWFQSSSGCGNPSFGSAGDRCISERVTPGAIYSYVDAFRTPIANDPRLAGAGCDTGNAVFLPSMQTGGYQQAVITSTGGSSTTGAPAATIPQTAITTTPAASSNLLLYGALGLAGVLFLVNRS